MSPITIEASEFGAQLKRWREERGCSQMDLALDADVSTRHVSFLETGRSCPSRRMVTRLAEALELPLRSRNTLLLAAGFAPRYRETSLDDQRMDRVRSSLEFLLERHEPYPAFVMDRCWNIVMGNRSHRQILGWLFEGREVAEPFNALRLVLDPEQLRPMIPNWEVVAQSILRRLDSQLCTPEPGEDLAALREEVLAYPGVDELLASRDSLHEDDILIPLVIEAPGVRLSWFSTLASFGTPLDVTLQELVIESFFPADDATEAFVRRQ